MTGPQRQPAPYVDPATGLANPAVSGPHGYPSGAYPYPVDPSTSGSYPPPGAFPVAPQGYPGGVYAADPSVSGSFPHPGAVPAAPMADPATSGSFPPPGSVPVGPQGFPSGAYPAGSGPFPVGAAGSGPHPGGSSGPDGGWSYGLPTGPRPDLLQTPIGQAGALRGNSWQQNAARGARYPWLVWAELKKLVGTTSDRAVMALSPIALIATLIATAQMNAGSSAADQATPVIAGVFFGPILLHIAVIKTFTGEWHYRSIQLSLLLQSSRAKYLAAQLGAVSVLWIVITVLSYVVYLPVRAMTTDSTLFQFHLSDRPLWFFGGVALAGLISMAWCMCMATLIPHPTAAVVVYFVQSYLLGAISTLASMLEPALLFASPMAAVNLYFGSNPYPISAVTSTIVVVGLLGLGVFLVSRRDAR